jgi:hypothetical protein
MESSETLVLDFYATRSPHLEAITSVAMEEAQKSKVTKLICDGSLPVCEVDPFGHKLLCKDCVRRNKDSVSISGISSELLKFESKSVWSSDFDLSMDGLDIRDLEYRGVNVGLGSISTYISYTRDQEVILNGFTRRLINKQLKAACLMVDVLFESFEKSRPGKVFVFNGRGIIGRAIVEVCNKFSVPFEAVEISGDKQRIERYKGSLPHSIEYRTNLIKEFWEKHDRNTLIYKSELFFDNKRTGRVTNDKVFTGKQMKGLFEDAVPDDSKVISIFNSSDDEIKSIGDEWHLSNQYNQSDVVYELVNGSRDQKITFVIRMHPNLDEVKAPWVKGWDRLKNLNHCVFIESDSEISSYDVLDSSDVVIVFGSTMGVEAAFSGKPVILFGNAFYQELGFCYRPRNIDELIKYCSLDLVPIKNDGPQMYASFLMCSGYESDYFKKLRNIDAEDYMASSRGNLIRKTGVLVGYLSRFFHMLIKRIIVYSISRK